MKFYFLFNILGCQCPFEITIGFLPNDLVLQCIKESRGNKIMAIKLLRTRSHGELSLLEAKHKIEDAMYKDFSLDIREKSYE